MLQFSSSQFSNLRWRYFVESLLLKSTPNVSSVVLSSARVAGVDRADARAYHLRRGVEEEIRRGARADRGGEQDGVQAHCRGLGGLCSRPPRRRHRFFDTVTLVVFSTAGAFLGLSLRVDAAWVIVTGVRYVTVCRASSRPANHAKKAPAAITTVTLDRKSG